MFGSNNSISETTVPLVEKEFFWNRGGTPMGCLSIDTNKSTILTHVGFSVLWIGIVFIRIRLPISIPIQILIRILPQILHMYKIRNLFTAVLVFLPKYSWFCLIFIWLKWIQIRILRYIMMPIRSDLDPQHWFLALNYIFTVTDGWLSR